MKIVKGITTRPIFYSRPCLYVSVILCLRTVFKGCKGIISVLYLQTIELIDNRKLIQIDPNHNDDIAYSKQYRPCIIEIGIFVWWVEY